MQEIRVDDRCGTCGKKSLSVVSYTTSGDTILLLTECFICGSSKTVTRKVKNGKAERMDVVSPVNTSSS